MFTFFFSKNDKFSAKSVLCCIIIAFLLIATNGEGLYAQAKLSVQGIVKKSNGVALDDGPQNITFSIYPVGSDSVLWFETIADVEVIGGIYSVILGGNGKNLDLPFNRDYVLGVKIGSSELLPRIALTSAPYALSLRGSSNQFPSSGPVTADTILVNGGIKVNNGVLAKGGAPGVNGANKAGYAFSGNNGDNDSGLFSTADGKASLYSNNAEILSVTPGTATVSGNLNTNNVDIINNGSLKYNGLGDWRLVDVDDFTSGNDDWFVYGPRTDIPALTQYTGWNNPMHSGGAPIANGGDFVGNILFPSSNRQVVKKQFMPSGSFSQIKVKFRYYFIESWGLGVGDMSFAGFANDASSSVFKVGWTVSHAYYFASNGNFNNSIYYNAANILGSTANWADHWVDAEMTARANGNSFWVVIGAQLDMDSITDEAYGVGAVEVYVR